MIYISLNDLIDVIPEMINLFLSGFIFMSFYNWLNHKEMDISIVTLWSVFVSVLISSICSTMHYYIRPDVQVPTGAKILMYSLLGFILALTITWVKNNVSFVKKLLYKTNNKSIHDDIFDDVIDYTEKTMINVYLKDSDVYYIGQFLYREEKGLDSWIALIDYCSVDKNTLDTIFNPRTSDYKSVVLLNLNNVERIELIYKDDTNVLKRLKYSDNSELVVEKPVDSQVAVSTTKQKKKSKHKKK